MLCHFCATPHAADQATPPPRPSPTYGAVSEVNTNPARARPINSRGKRGRGRVGEISDLPPAVTPPSLC